VDTELVAYWHLPAAMMCGLAVFLARSKDADTSRPDQNAESALQSLSALNGTIAKRFCAWHWAST